MTKRSVALTRIEAIDWLRGLAVIFMIGWHAFDAWLAPWAKSGELWWWIGMMGGLPSRMFLLLVGVAAAIRFEGQLARGVDTATMRWQTARRGLEIVALAYLFRLQEHILAGFKGGWPMLFKVDILNVIGVSLLLIAVLATPRQGKPRYLVPLIAAAIFLGLGPLIGPTSLLPPSPALAPLTSYIGGARPMAAFPIFPWGSWGLLGVVVGHLWIRFSREHGQAKVFLVSGALGVLSTGTVLLVRAIDPYVIRYSSELSQNMGPGAFFYRLGIIGVLAAVAWMVTALDDRFSRVDAPHADPPPPPTAWQGLKRFSVLKQFGRTSLLVYWIHVNLCYGGVARPLKGQLSIGRATLWILGLIALMLVVSLLKTRYWEPVRGFVAGRLRRERDTPMSAGGLGS